jgi:hypothetical protein
MHAATYTVQCDRDDLEKRKVTPPITRPFVVLSLAQTLSPGLSLVRTHNVRGYDGFLTTMKRRRERERDKEKREREKVLKRNTFHHHSSLFRSFPLSLLSLSLSVRF